MKKSWFDDIVSTVVFLLLVTTFIPFGYSAPKIFKFDRARAEGFVAFIVNSYSTVEEEETVEMCDGSGFITHGDGHKTPCPGCDKCQSGQISPPVQEDNTTAVVEPEIIIEPTQSVKKKDFSETLREVTLAYQLGLQNPTVLDTTREGAEGKKIIMFTASWCGPCNQFKKYELPKLKNVKINLVDIDDPKNKDIIRQYRRSNSIPEFVKVVKDKRVNSKIGYQKASTIERWYNE